MSDSPVSTLLPLFKKRFPDFQDFQQGDSKFIEEEDYKREILRLWQEADGEKQISELVAAGKGVEALRLLRITTKIGSRVNNLIGQWDISKELEKADEKLCALFRNVASEFAVEAPPKIKIDRFLSSCEEDQVPLNWALFFYLLWLYNPDEFFPVKISAIRSVAEKCAFEIKAGAFNQESLHQIYEFVTKVKEGLADLNPRDLLDAQSFIWSCHSEMENTNELHKLWAEFLERWPIERLREMTLEEYTNLKSNTDDYFCYWVERKTESLGSISGGFATIFGIYRSAKEEAKLRKGQKTDDDYIWWESMGDDASSAFNTAKNLVLKIVEEAQNGEHSPKFEEHLGPMFQLKLRFLYQQKPYKLLPMFSREFLTKVSERYMDEKCTYKNMIDINLRLRSEHFPDEDVFEVMYRMVEENKSAERPRRYWAGGTYWDGEQMVDEFMELDEWRSGFTEETAQDSPDGRLFWENYPQVQVGDWFAMKGYGGTANLRIYYVGEVTGKDEDRFAISLKKLEDIPLFRDKAPKKGGKSGWQGTTLVDVVNPEAIYKIFGVGDAPDFEMETNMSSRKELNQILYGPPGTGKTYSTVRQAVAIVDGSHEEESVQPRFQDLKREGRIDFLTFHQSYSYEDFVEGIRPDMSGASTAQFKLKDGIFKRLAVTATYNCLEELVDETPPPIDFEAAWEQLCREIDSNPTRVFEVKGMQNAYVLSVSALGHIVGTENSSKEEFTCNKEKAARLQSLAQSKLARISAEDVERTLGDTANADFVAFVINLLHPAQETLDPDTASYEEMRRIVQAYLLQGAPSGYRLKAKTEWPQFVLIIDEINRGNISKILGELITLLEPDKRLGADNELTVQLPYSQEVFAVPGNLYLIGTMNTADKSIALVDVALRRRFQFVELNPNFNYCQSLPDDLQSVMETINQRIMIRKDRDHRIGHAYFMDVDSEESFDEVMKRKIIPLLSEYFYNDWDGLRFVLGENESNTGLIRPLNGESGVGRTRWQWYYDQGSEDDLSPAQVLLNNFKPKTEAEGAE